jgi:hypothetical protein
MNKKQFDTLMRGYKAMTSMGYGDCQAPCIFSHDGTGLELIPTSKHTDMCNRFMCRGMTVESSCGRKVCLTCKIISGGFRSEQSYNHMGCHRPIVKEATAGERKIYSIVDTMLFRMKSIEHDTRWPRDTVASLKTLCVKMLKAWEDKHAEERAGIAKLSEEEQEKAKRRQKGKVVERRAQRNVFMTATGILWLALVKDNKKYGHIGMAKEFAKIMDKNVDIESVLKRISRSIDFFRRGITPAVSMTVKTTNAFGSGFSVNFKSQLDILGMAGLLEGSCVGRVNVYMHRFKANILPEDIRRKVIPLQIAATENHAEALRLSIVALNKFAVEKDTKHLRGVNDKMFAVNIDGAHISKETYTNILEMGNAEEVHDVIAIHRDALETRLKEKQSMCINLREEEMRLKNPQTTTMDIKFLKEDKEIYVVITVCGGDITDVYSTYVPRNFRLRDAAGSPSIRSYRDGDKVVRINERKDREIRKADLLTARPATANCADGTEMQVYVLDTPSVISRYDNKVVLIKGPNGFELGSRKNTLKCFSAETPRNKFVGSIMSAVNHMDPNCTILSNMFSMYMPPNYGKNNVIHEVQHFADTAYRLFEGDKMNGNDELSRLRDNFMDKCRGEGHSENKVLRAKGDSFSVTEIHQNVNYETTYRALEVSSRLQIGSELLAAVMQNKEFGLVVPSVLRQLGVSQRNIQKFLARVTSTTDMYTLFCMIVKETGANATSVFEKVSTFSTGQRLICNDLTAKLASVPAVATDDQGAVTRTLLLSKRVKLFSNGDRYTSIWTSKKGVEFITEHTCTEVRSRHYIGVRLMKIFIENIQACELVHIADFNLVQTKEKLQSLVFDKLEASFPELVMNWAAGFKCDEKITSQEYAERVFNLIVAKGIHPARIRDMILSINALERKHMDLFSNFKAELEMIPASASDWMGRIIKTDRSRRKRKKVINAASASPPWKSINEFTTMYVKLCVSPICAHLYDTFWNCTRGYVMQQCINARASNLLSLFVEICETGGECRAKRRPVTRTHWLEKLFVDISTRGLEDIFEKKDLLKKWQGWLQLYQTKRKIALLQFSKIIIGNFFKRSSKMISGRSMELDVHAMFEFFKLLPKHENDPCKKKRKDDGRRNRSTV